MKLKEFIVKKAKGNNSVSDLCVGILNTDQRKGYDWSGNDKEILSAIELDVFIGPGGGDKVEAAFQSFKKAYEKQM